MTKSESVAKESSGEPHNDQARISEKEKNPVENPLDQVQISGIWDMDKCIVPDKSLLPPPLSHLLIDY